MTEEEKLAADDLDLDFQVDDAKVISYNDGDQHFRKIVQLSNVTKAVSVAGRDQELAYQVIKAIKEIKRDIFVARQRRA